MQGQCPLPQGIHTKSLEVVVPKFDGGVLTSMFGSVRLKRIFNCTIFLYFNVCCFIKYNIIATIKDINF